MAVRTGSSSGSAGLLSRSGILLGLAATASVPVGVAASRYDERVTLVYGVAGGAAAAIVLGLVSTLIARRLRRRRVRTLERVGSVGALRACRLLGLLGLLAGLTAALALGFFGLLELFATSSG